MGCGWEEMNAERHMCNVLKSRPGYISHLEARGMVECSWSPTSWFPGRRGEWTLVDNLKSLPILLLSVIRREMVMCLKDAI